MELWRVAQELSLFFDKNLLVYDDVKNKKVSCNIKDLPFTTCLDLVSWMSGVEWYEKDNVFFIGGNKDYIEVLDNTNIASNISTVFSGVTVRIVEDKIIVMGTERNVKRVADAIRQLQKKELISIRVFAYEISDDSLLKLGIDIDKSISYAFSWQALATNAYNPVQHLALTLAASLEMDRNSDDLKLLVDTNLTCISGKTQSLTLGEAIDRPLNSTNEQGNVYTTGYQTVQIGYILNLQAYKYSKDMDWIFDFNIENTSEVSELRRNRLLLKNTVLLNQKIALVGRIIKNSESVSVTKGIPFLSDIPFLGYFFRVTEEQKTRRHVLFFVERLDSVNSLFDSGSIPRVKQPLLHLNERVKQTFDSVLDKFE